MATVKQIEANQANALQSTGPRTPAGKAASSQNALKHGLLSRSALLPGENGAEFSAFQQAMFADLEPEGAMEESLVERIVDLFWRLRRVPRFEAAIFQVDAIRQRRAEANWDVTTLESAADAAEAARQYNRSYTAELERLQGVSFQRHTDDPSEREARQRNNETFADWDEARGRVSLAEDELKEELAKIGTTLLNRQAELGHLSRYEAAIQRNLIVTMHEFQRLQAARSGAAVLAPVAVDIGLSAG